MIRSKKRLVAVLGGAAVVAGVLFVSPAQAAMSCQAIPGQTIGTDVKIGPVIQRVPAIANIKLCYGTGTVPVASVTTYGGTCTSNCLTVTLGGGAVDLEGVSLSWTEDGLLKTQAVNPTPVDGAPSTCVLSVGMPDAPNPNCFIAIGPDDPTGVTAPVIAAVNNAVDTAFDLVDYAGQVAGDAYGITCSLIPDRSGYDFCTDPNGWTNSTTDYYYNYACNRVPDQQGSSYYENYEFCSDPIGWTNALIDNAAGGTYETTCDTMGYAYDPQTGYSYYFCDNALGWTTAVLNTWCGGVCDGSTLDEYLYTVREILRSIQIT